MTTSGHSPYNYIQPDDDTWDVFVRNHPRAHFLQLSAWATLKAKYGWRKQRIALTRDDTIIAGAQWLLRDLPLGLGTLAYIPFGAYVTDDNQWSALWDATRKHASDAGARFLKWEPGFYINDTPPDFAQWGFQPSAQRVQPPRTMMIDLHASDDEIMAQMNQGTRRKIRKSEKNNIRYTIGTRDDVVRFSELMQTTGERNDFGVHTAQYYLDAYDLFAPDDAALIIAEHDGDLLAGNFVFGIGSTACYLYGASANEKRNLMASYGVQWHGIQWAKERGFHYYDMWGIPDETPETLEAEFQSRNDGLWGVYGFKRGWGGAIHRSEGAWDLPNNPLIYQLYRVALRLRG